MYLRMSVCCLSLVSKYRYLISDSYNRAFASFDLLCINDMYLINNNTLFQQIVI